MISESNLSLQLGRSVYPHNSQSTLFSGLFDEKKDHPQCQTQKIPIGHRSTFSNNTCSPPGSRSRSTSLPRSPPLSSTPYLPHLLSLEVNQTKKKDIHRSNVKKKVIAKTLDPSLNHPSPTNTIKYMKDNNIVKKIDTVHLKKTSEIQNLVPTRTNYSLTSVQSLVSDSIPTHSHTPQQLCTTPSKVYTNYSVDSTTNNRSTNFSKSLSGFYSRNPRPPAYFIFLLFSIT